MKREQIQKTILNVYNFMKKAVGERATVKTSQNTMYLISFRVESCTEMRQSCSCHLQGELIHWGGLI